MSPARTFRMVAKDFRLSPRTPMFLYAVIMPLLLTFLLQVVFRTLLDPMPRLGIADLGESEISARVAEIDGIDLTIAASAAELRNLVERNDVDAGFVLQNGFDTAVRAGERPEFRFYVSGESLAANRVLLALTAIDRVRDVEGKAAPVEVVLGGADDEEVPPIFERLLPSLLMFVLLAVGIFYPAFMLVQERENRTLAALLVTPVKVSEVLLAKAVLGFVTVVAMCYLILALNGIRGAELLALLVPIAVAAVICNEIGLIYGSVAGDAKSLYSLVKTLNIFLVGPVIFYLFPSWPQWIAKLFPTYWFVDPLYRVALRGESLADVSGTLAVAVGIGVALMLPVAFLGRRLATAQ